MKQHNTDPDYDAGELIKQMQKNMEDLYSGSIFDQEINGAFTLPSGYEVDRTMDHGNKVYSGILGKYIDANTGKVIEE